MLSDYLLNIWVFSLLLKIFRDFALQKADGSWYLGTSSTEKSADNCLACALKSGGLDSYGLMSLRKVPESTHYHQVEGCYPCLAL